MEAENRKIEELKEELEVIAEEEKKVKEAKDLLTSHRDRMATLKRQSALFDRVVSKNNNPQKLLETVAKSMPEDLWLTRLQMTDDRINIGGMALTYKSIGDFLKKINGTLYFSQSLALASSSTLPPHTCCQQQSSSPAAGSQPSSSPSSGHRFSASPRPAKCCRDSTGFQYSQCDSSNLP